MSTCEEVAADSWPYGLSGAVCSQGQGHDTSLAMADEDSQGCLSKQPSDVSPFFGRMPAMCQMVAAGGQVELWNPLQVPPPSLLLCADTSQTGWGAYLQDLTTAGMWTPQKREFHISVLEMKVVQLALNVILHRIKGEALVLISGILQEVGRNCISGHL